MEEELERHEVAGIGRSFSAEKRKDRIDSGYYVLNALRNRLWYASAVVMSWPSMPSIQFLHDRFMDLHMILH
eukprot:366400-Chlamydomonas_euryale.AAC.3